MITTLQPTKTCTKCHRALPLSMYAAHKETRDGLQSWCRLCKTAQMQALRAARKADQ